jgi:hypothetical protein
VVSALIPWKARETSSFGMVGHTPVSGAGYIFISGLQAKMHFWSHMHMLLLFKNKF